MQSYGILNSQFSKTMRTKPQLTRQTPDTPLKPYIPLKKKIQWESGFRHKIWLYRFSETYLFQCRQISA